MGAFVGRVSELVAIERLTVEARRSGRPGTAFVFGEPGSGKSRLLRELRRSLAASGGLMELVGYEPEREIPLAASRSLMGALAATSGAGARLERLVFGDPAGDPVDALRIFDAVERSLVETGTGAILVDDLQWVDSASRALLHYLVRTAHEAHRPLLLVAAGREAPEARTFAQAVLQSLDGGELVLSLELPPLEEAAGIALARSLSERLTAEAARTVWQQARGSPFWIEAIARSDRSQDLDALMTARLRGGGPDAREALALAAVVGRPLTADEAAAVLGWPSPRMRAATKVLLDRGLAVLTEAGMRTAHDLIREAVVARLPARARARLHRLLAEQLASHEADPQALREALEHRAAGGLPTVDLALRVARSPQRRLLDEHDLALLARSADDASGSDPLALELSAEVASLAGDLGRASLALERWNDLRSRLTLPAGRATAALEASRMALRLGRGAEAEALVEVARTEPELPTPLVIELDSHASLLLRHVRHAPAEGRRRVDRALSAARQLALAAGGSTGLDEPARRAYLVALGGAYDIARLDDDDPEAMLALAEEAIAIPTTSEWRALGARFTQALALRPHGRWHEAAASLQRIWNDADRWAFPAIAAEVGYWLADSLRVLGRWDEAAQAAQATMELGGRVEDPRAVSDSRWVLQVIALSRGDRRSAFAEIQRGIAEEADPHYRIEARDTLAAWLARVGGPGTADASLAQLEAASADASAAACRRCRSESGVAAIGTLARLGQRERALQLAVEWDEATPRPSPVAALRRAWSGALVLLASGDAARALADLEAAADAAAAMGMRPEALWMRIDAADAAEASLGRDAAVTRLLRSRQEAIALGAVTEQSVADRSLRRLGVRTWRRGRASPPGHVLRGRAREVARLIVSGASNPEIAASLFLSRKTVESHVSALLARFEVRNRTELAKRLGELSALDAER